MIAQICMTCTLFAAGLRPPGPVDSDAITERIARLAVASSQPWSERVELKPRVIRIAVLGNRFAVATISRRIVGSVMLGKWTETLILEKRLGRWEALTVHRPLAPFPTDGRLRTETPEPQL